MINVTGDYLKKSVNSGRPLQLEWYVCAACKETIYHNKFNDNFTFYSGCKCTPEDIRDVPWNIAAEYINSQIDDTLRVKLLNRFGVIFIPLDTPRFPNLTTEEQDQLRSCNPEEIEREYMNTWSTSDDKTNTNTNLEKEDAVASIGNPSFISWVNRLSSSPEMIMLDKAVIQFDRVKMGLSVDDIEILRSRGYRIEYRFASVGNTQQDTCELILKDRYYLG